MGIVVKEVGVVEDNGVVAMGTREVTLAVRVLELINLSMHHHNFQMEAIIFHP